jgi:hypothetical protein
MRAKCFACQWVERIQPLPLKNYWFARAGQRTVRAFPWGELMYNRDKEKTGVCYVDTLILVRSENLAEAHKEATKLKPSWPRDTKWTM